MVRQLKEVEEIVRTVIRIVDQRYPVRAAYLFGSYADGVPRDDSDIDIAIFAEGVESEDIDTRMDFIAQVQKTINTEIELHLFAAQQLNELRPTNFPGYISSHGKKIAA